LVITEPVPITTLPFTLPSMSISESAEPCDLAVGVMLMGPARLMSPSMVVPSVSAKAALLSP